MTDLHFEPDKFFKTKKHQNVFIFFLLFFLSVFFVFSKFVKFVENREGFEFEDPVLALFNPIDLSVPIFILIYGSIVYWIWLNRKDSVAFIMFFLSYGLMVCLRILFMFSLPLDSPSSAIVLVDPLVNFLSSSEPLTKDLFFSGHTATMVILTLNSRRGVGKALLMVFTFLVALGVLLQHVHYFVDVLVAPFVAYFSFLLSKHICNSLKIKA
jgi:membrane-associated phospholipid phosphatase